MKNLTKRKYSGIRQKHVNHTVWNLYGYKFYENTICLSNLKSFALEDLQDIDFDIVIPINPRNSGSDIVYRIAKHIAFEKNAQLVECLNHSNSTVNKLFADTVKGKNVLIVDDVYTTGRTAARAEKAIKSLKPASVSFYALAKAKEK